ncbi:MAG: hypothetical protein OXC29_00630, partial [Rhodococcus sp.]|nr:hypothetical protein [Rhodococcus sp. (in: high G+C Gram-positive bacteria)]
NYTLTLADGTWTATFAPESTDVALGASGQSVTLTQLEAGGYGIDGAAIEPGHTYTAANGNYTLTMADGVWTATFAPMMHEVQLGRSGDSVTIVQMETGGYSLNGEPITLDTTATASNGATYGIALGPDGPMVMYIPDTVTVMLGDFGGELTLTLQQNRTSYRRDDEPFESGTVVTANERDYMVTLVDGVWMAEFIEPMPMAYLGESGLTVTLIQDEAGGWRIQDLPVSPGAEYEMEFMGNTNTYILMLGEDGTWTGVYQPFHSDPIMLGTSGDTQVLIRDEMGGWWTDPDTPFASGETVMSTNGNVYTLTIGEDGMWGAMHTPMMVDVMLGTEGGTITLALQEDRMTWHKDGEVFMSGGEVMVMFDDRTNTYTVTMDMETGMWSAEYVPYRVMVDLGTSTEKQELIRDEMGGWWERADLDDPDARFNSGETVMSSSGNVYRLTYGEDGWGAMYIPATMAIMGTGLTAVANEDGTGYTIMEYPGQGFKDGMGKIETPEGNFRIHTDEDGNLVGLQFEEPVNTQAAAAKVQGAYFGDGGPGNNKNVVSVDDAKTEGINEAGTTIDIDGETHLIGDLFQDGESMVAGDNIVDGVREELATLAAQIKALVGVQAQEVEDKLERTNFSNQYRQKWFDIDFLLDKVFGADRADPTDENEFDHIDALPTGVLSEAAVKAMDEMLDKIVAALADLDGF